MGKINDSIIRTILDRADIVEVVGDFVKLRKSGVNFTGLCPFHADTNDGNFIVRPKTVSKYPNTWHCFKCDKGGGCVEFLQRVGPMTFPEAIRYLGKKYTIEVDDVPFDYVPPPPRPTPPPPPDMELPREWVRQTMKDDLTRTTLIQWLSSIQWDSCQQQRLKEVLWLYCIGAWRDGRVVFWMIDEKGVPRSAKLMQYLPNGHRDKERNPGWIYNQDGYRQQCDPDGHTVLKPLFGLHLLDRYPHAAIHIVESEKTAIIMAIAYGNHANQVWMACGGLENLNREKLAPLIRQHRHITLYPDRDGVTAWKQRAEQLHYDRVSVDTDPVLKWWKPEDGEKADIADVVVRMMNTMKIYKTVSEVVEDLPAVQAMHEKLKLEIIEQSNNDRSTENQR